VDDEPLSGIASKLYALPPEEFVAARDEAARQARATGDRRLAAAIGKLRRPTVGAWAVNLLARERPELIGELLDLGDALRSAQRNLRGDDLRELSLQRRVVISTLAREAVGLARRDFHRDNLPVAEIQATLTAALADAETAELVRAGQLTKTVEYGGFGETPRPRLRLVHGGRSDTPTQEERGQERVRQGAAARKEAAEREATEKAEREAAEKAEREAAEKAEREAAEKAEREAAERARREAERAAAARLQRARAAAHRELLAARTELAEAEAARVIAERAVKAARRRVEKASAALNGLAGDDDG
jgi:hypothetical protein